MPVALRTCRTCQQALDLDRFYFNGSRPFLDCKKCYVAMQEVKRGEFIEWIHAYKVLHGCVDCGFNASPYALQFDHIPGRGKKTFGIASGASRSRAKVLAEMDLCDVRCANCHAMKTAQRIAERKMTEAA